MQYRARIAQEGKYWLTSFPDCPGCQTFGDSREEALTMAGEALSGWIEAHLVDGESPPRPKAKRGTPVSVAANVAIAVEVRWMREDLHLTQTQLAKKVKVSQQAIAKLERPAGNPSIETLARLAKALGRQVNVTFEAA
jgi:predicted RNase H-like HicB family nuclease/DNA-binding XRE family transcriptional regulator